MFAEQHFRMQLEEEMNPYRADVIGSLLRPQYLLEARENYAVGNMPHAHFKTIEDHAVDECIAIQERAGVDVVTDGEIRRDVFASQLAQSCDGFDRVQNNEVDWFTLDGRVERSPVTVGVISKIRRKRHLSSEEYVYLRAKTKRPKKITLPSPTMYAYYWVPGVSNAAYPTTDAYMADIVDILRDEVSELVRLGAEYIQIDAPEFGMIIDSHQQEWFARKGFRPERILHDGIAMIDAIVADYPRVTFGLHICRGNDASRYMARGSYDSIAAVAFHTKAQRLLLEYDDQRSGDFGALRSVPDDKTVVLGLVTTKSPRRETPEELHNRILEASRYVPLDRLALSPQCGFASVAKGNSIPSELQEWKLKLVANVAREVWPEGDLGAVSK
jgi:5-methyltetrahydropteroyltriglutamate--homocysteine methyltransferase